MAIISNLEKTITENLERIFGKKIPFLSERLKIDDELDKKSKESREQDLKEFLEGLEEFKDKKNRRPTFFRGDYTIADNALRLKDQCKSLGILDDYSNEIEQISIEAHKLIGETDLEMLLKELANIESGADAVIFVANECKYKLLSCESITEQLNNVRNALIYGKSDRVNPKSEQYVDFDKLTEWTHRIVKPELYKELLYTIKNIEECWYFDDIEETIFSCTRRVFGEKPDLSPQQIEAIDEIRRGKIISGTTEILSHAKKSFAIMTSLFDSRCELCQKQIDCVRTFDQSAADKFQITLQELKKDYYAEKAVTLIYQAVGYGKIKESTIQDIEKLFKSADLELIEKDDGLFDEAKPESLSFAVTSLNRVIENTFG